MPTVPTACRTAVVLAFLLALAAAARPGWAAGGLAAALLAVWLAPLVVGAGQRVAGARGGAQVSSAIPSMPSQTPKPRNSAAAP